MGVVIRVVALVAAAVVAAGATVAWVQAKGGDDASAAPTRTSASFVKLAKPTSGQATLIVRGDERRLVLSSFRTQPAPETYVYLVPGVDKGGEIEGGTKVAQMQVFSGRVEYSVPAGVDTDLPLTVVIWCELCETAWGTAVLREPVEPV